MCICSVEQDPSYLSYADNSILIDCDVLVDMCTNFNRCQVKLQECVMHVWLMYEFNADFFFVTDIGGAISQSTQEFIDIFT